MSGIRTRSAASRSGCVFGNERARDLGSGEQLECECSSSSEISRPSTKIRSFNNSEIGTDAYDTDGQSASHRERCRHTTGRSFAVCAGDVNERKRAAAGFAIASMSAAMRDEIRLRGASGYSSFDCFKIDVAIKPRKRIAESAVAADVQRPCGVRIRLG